MSGRLTRSPGLLPRGPFTSKLLHPRVKTVAGSDETQVENTVQGGRRFREFLLPGGFFQQSHQQLMSQWNICIDARRRAHLPEHESEQQADVHNKRVGGF